MDSITRKHVERALRVVDFARQHPSDLPGHVAALARLGERISQLAAVGEEEFGSRRGAHAAISRRTELRTRLGAGFRMVAGIARTAGVESVGTPIVLRFPGPRDNQVQFLAGGRRIVADATAQAALLEKYGLPAGHLAELSEGLDQFAALLSERDEAVRAHVGARQRLKALVREIRAVVEQMHAINLYRFRDDPALLAMWRSSRDLRVTFRKPAATTAPAANPPATAGDLRPAA